MSNEDLKSIKNNILKDKDIELINKIDYDIEVDYKLNLFIAKKDRVDYVYNTAALEGNPFTLPEVQTLLEGVTVGGHKLSDEQMILNQNKSVNLLFDLINSNEFGLNKETLLKLHTEVSYEEALEWGKFRSGNVRITGTSYLAPKSQYLDEIFSKNMEKLEEIKYPINRAIIYFLLGARNQYFYGGNKRTSRLMMNGELLSNGYPLLNIKVKDQLEFNKTMIEYYDTNNILRALEYLSKYYLKQSKELND